MGGVFCFPVVKAKISIFDGHVDLRCARSAIFFKDFDFLGRGSSKFRSPAGASAEQDLGLGAWLSKSWKKSWVLIASLSLGTRSSSFLPILRLGVRARRRERRRCGARGVPDTTLPPWTVLTPAVGGYPPTPYKYSFKILYAKTIFEGLVKVDFLLKRPKRP